MYKMNKNNKTLLVLLFALVFSGLAITFIFFSNFTVNVLSNIKKELDKNVFNKWIGILFTINIFIFVLILFFRNIKNQGERGNKGDKGEKGDSGENENCINC